MTALEFINLACPYHEPASDEYDGGEKPPVCDDENLANGFYSWSEEGHARCARCGLLQLLQGQPLPEGWDEFPGSIEIDW